MQTLIAEPKTRLKRASQTLPALEDGILMTSEILSVVIDERNRMDGFNSATLMQMSESPKAGEGNHQRVFKDYILSSEVFYIDTSLN
jgi:hypothetical protein